ncbi:MAG TPA: hypothetical protein VMI54_15230 [Polyangiaceae bacterium]|nr:hypothetical protein [Polyangiaceae bacterium]
MVLASCGRSRSETPAPAHGGESGTLAAAGRANGAGAGQGGKAGGGCGLACTSGAGAGSANAPSGGGGDVEASGQGGGGELAGQNDAEGATETPAGAGGVGGGAVAGAGQGGVSGGGRAGASAAGAENVAGNGTFTCVEPVPTASCNAVRDWGVNALGGLFVFGDLRTDFTNTESFHVTGSVGTYSGFGVYFNACTDLSAYRSMTFTLSGTSGSVDATDVVRFVVQQNADEPPDQLNRKGGCPGPASNCSSPFVYLGVGSTPQTVAFSSLTNGAPLAGLDPTQLLGLEWLIAPDASGTPFAVDLTLDDLTFDGASGAPVDCPLSN